MSADKRQKESTETVNLAHLQLFRTANTDDTFMAKPTLKKCISYDELIKIMPNAVVPLDTGVVVILIYLEFISSSRRTSVTREPFQNLQAATKTKISNQKTPHSPHTSRKNCISWYGSGAAPHLVVNFILAITFRDRYICRTSVLERKIVLYHAPPVEIVTNPKPGHNVNITQNTYENLEQIRNQDNNISVFLCPCNSS